MLDRLCDDIGGGDDGENGDFVHGEFDGDGGVGREQDDFLRSQSCASLSHVAAGDKVGGASASASAASKKRRWSHSTPALPDDADVDADASESISREAAPIGLMDADFDGDDDDDDEADFEEDSTGDKRRRRQQQQQQQDGTGEATGLDDTTAANLKAFDELQKEIFNLKNQVWTGAANTV